jgi:outer membrane autotransporter protein
MNSFNETGAQSLDYQGLNWNTASMIYNLGANCAYNWKASRNLTVVPQVNLAWQHEFMQNPYNINGNLSGTPVVNTSSAPLRDTLYTGVGVTLEYKKRWNTAFFYNAAAGNSDLVSQNIFWSLGCKF